MHGHVLRIRLPILLCVAYLHILLTGYGSALNGPAWDEVGHLVAGLEHWQEGSHELYKVNPPLPRMVATLPIVAVGHHPLRVETSPAFPGRPEWSTGITFVNDHGEQFFRFLTWARWACLPFSLLGAYICYRWARELAGEAAGLMAFSFWCLGPTMLANAQLITPDLAAASIGLMAAYAFRHWLKRPVWSTALVAGGCLGLALLCKVTWVILLGLWPALWVCLRRFSRADEAPAEREQDGAAQDRRAKPDYNRTANTEFLQLCVLLTLAVWLVNLGYEFDGSLQPLGDYRFVSEQWRGIPNDEWEGFPTGNVFRGTALAHLPVPLPAPYVEGIDFQRLEFDAEYWSYLLGTRRQRGWWSYYVLSLLWKIPIGFWIVGLVGTAEWLRVIKRGGTEEESTSDGQSGRRRANAIAEAALLCVPALTIMVLVSSHTGFTHHMRYVLPVVPFGFVWASRAAATLSRGYNLGSALTACGLAWGILSSLCAYPDSLAYFNGLVGGTSNAHYYMGLGPMDSNLEWGQDLLRLAEWIRNNPKAGRMDGIAYGGLGQVKDAAGLNAAWPPAGMGEDGPGDEDVCSLGPKPGWYALGVKHVFSNTSDRTYFQHLEPYAVIGHTAYVYHVTEAQADELWQRLHGAQYDRSGCSWRKTRIAQDERHGSR